MWKRKSVNQNQSQWFTAGAPGLSGKRCPECKGMGAAGRAPQDTASLAPPSITACWASGAQGGGCQQGATRATCRRAHGKNHLAESFSGSFAYCCLKSSHLWNLHPPHLHRQPPLPPPLPLKQFFINHGDLPPSNNRGCLHVLVRKAQREQQEALGFWGLIRQTLSENSGAGSCRPALSFTGKEMEVTLCKVTWLAPDKGAWRTQVSILPDWCSCLPPQGRPLLKTHSPWG